MQKIRAAYDQIPAVFRNTPQFVSAGISQLTRCHILLKIECINPIRSFKGRGASVFLHSQPASATLVTASAGNFGQALAYAARDNGQRVIIFSATNCNPAKIDRMKALGAEVRLLGSDFDAAKECARAYAESERLRFVEDGVEPELSAGAATIGLELTSQHESIAAIACPIGNGSLINGVGSWMRAEAPKCKVLGVCASGAPATMLSWRAGQVRTTSSVDTAADGIAVRVPIERAVEEMRATVDEMSVVSDAQLQDAVRLLHREVGLIVEPAGAAGLAAVLAAPGRFANQLVVAVVTGGNIDPAIAAAWLEPVIEGTNRTKRRTNK